MNHEASAVRTIDRIIPSWQADYQAATGKDGRVVGVHGVMDRHGWLSIVVTVIEDLAEVQYVPYFNQSPYDGAEPGMSDGEQFDVDAVAWVNTMTGATNWAEWDWEVQS